MTNKSPLSALIIEPNKTLTVPYKFLSSEYHTTRVATIERGIAELKKVSPNLVMISCSFAAEDILKVLAEITRQSAHHLPKVVMVVDFSHPVSQIVGTQWAGEIEVLSSRSMPNASFL